MPRLTRKNIKVFASSATNNGVFGSLQANNPTTTSDVEQLQSLSAWEQGWNSATETSEELPPLEEIQGVEYVTTYQQAYLMQEGIPEWASSVTYYKGSVVKEVTSTGFKIYNSLTDNNTGNLLSDTSNWKLVMDSDDVYAFDNTVVHKAGAETISGTKTFASGIISKEGGTYANYASGSQNYLSLDAYDSTGILMGMVDCWTETDGTTETRILCHNPNNSNIYSWIAAKVDANGNIFTSAPTPASNSNDNNIATTAWVNTVGNNVVHLTGNELIDGAKTLAKSKQSAIEGGQIAFEPPTSTSLTGNAFIDIYGNLMRFVGKNSSGNYTTPLYLDLETGVAIATPSDAPNSVVTTMAISKGANGYVKLGNGMIIQWGAGYSNPVTFPTPFSSIPAVTGSPTYNGRTQDGHGYVWNVTTTSFEYRCDNDMLPYRWIAVGY